MLQTILNVLLVVLIIAIIVMAVLYFAGSKLQTRQAEQQKMLDAASQTVSMLIIDKKKLKITKSGLPQTVIDQTPKYMRFSKLPIVKAKIGPKVVTLIADAQVFEILPVKTEVKVDLSGLYITKLRSVRGGTVPAAPKKKGFFDRFKKSAKPAPKEDKKKEVKKAEEKDKKKTEAKAAEPVKTTPPKETETKKEPTTAQQTAEAQPKKANTNAAVNRRYIKHPKKKKNSKKNGRA